MTHHAYLAQPTTVNKAVVSCFFDTSPFADVSYLELQTFGIDDVRKLTEVAYSTPTVGEKKLLVVMANELTVEAQQALLKILEEPPQTTVFLFVLPRGFSLLATLLSRFERLDVSQIVDQSEEAFDEFLALGVGPRITLIAKRLDDKDTLWVAAIKRGLLAYLDKNSTKLPKGVPLSALVFVADYLQTRGASNKQLLEELALTLPPSGR